MNFLTQLLVSVYSRMLNLYPGRFREEFADEMQVVFRDSVNETARDGILRLVILCLRELGGLPFNILREFWHELGRKETVMVTNEKVEQDLSNSVRSSHWEAFLSALPFAVFGVACIINKVRVPWPIGIYVFLTFYCLVLLGLLIGLVKAFPRWAYSYLGGSLVFAWWWTSMQTRGLKLFGYTFGNEAWGWRAWAPLFITVGVAILLTRSIRPLRELVFGIWQDWTFLSLVTYSLIGFMMLLYDEVRSPYTIAFMTASTLVVCASAWIFMRIESHLHRLGILLGGFFGSLIIDRICATTWDLYTYNELPAQPTMPWYNSLPEIIFYTVLWSPIIWLPALVGLFKTTFNKEPTS
ncbi:MAG: hypothetical protein ABI621_15670 [Chloroflexota bacterium]